ncbi:MAG: MarR family transcriptional regulator [Ruminococcus sp.]|nr:MarR family transcriptional regulator [Ruminococcus sp.]
MDYEKSAEELMNYMVLGEEHGRLIHHKLSELAHGELAVLRYLSEEKNGANAKDLSKRFKVNTSRTTAILNSLEKKKLIDRVRDKHDKRCIHVYIKPEGTLYERRLRRHYIKQAAMLLEEIGEEDTKNYIKILRHILEISRIIPAK